MRESVTGRNPDVWLSALGPDSHAQVGARVQQTHLDAAPLLSFRLYAEVWLPESLQTRPFSLDSRAVASTEKS